MQTGILITFFGIIFSVATIQTLLDRKSRADERRKELPKKQTNDQ